MGQQYQTGAANRLLDDGTFTYEYDAEGNRTLRENIADGSTTEYFWDLRNRLTIVTFQTAAGTVAKRVAYEYDVFDHRIGKQVDDNGDGGFDRFERYVWDGLDVVLDFVDADGDGPGQYALQTRRLFGTAVDQVLAEEDAATSAVDWLLADNQGTVRDVVDSAGQLVSGGHFVFDSFGKLTSGDASLIRHLYTGQEFDADLALYYYNARWYDPATHTFLSVDPIKDGRNWYAYVENNSVNRVDRTGLADEEPSSSVDLNSEVIPPLSISPLSLNNPPPVPDHWQTLLGSPLNVKVSGYSTYCALDRLLKNPGTKPFIETLTQSLRYNYGEPLKIVETNLPGPNGQLLVGRDRENGNRVLTEIRLRPVADSDALLSTLLFELANASQRDEFSRLFTLAFAGEISRDEYVRAVEELEYKSMKLHHELMQRFLVWNPCVNPNRILDRYANDLANGSKTFEDHFTNPEWNVHRIITGNIYDDIRKKATGKSTPP